MFGLIDADRVRLSEFLPWVEWTRSADDERNYVNAVRAQWDNHEFFDYAMFSDDQYLGNIGVHTINWMTATCEIGYWILGAHEGRGYVREACARLTELCFERGFHRVEIRCNPANARSAQVPRRLGYRLEGCLRESGIDQFGQHHDVLVFAKLRDDVSRAEVARPACVRHWAEADVGPQSYSPDSLELFGSLAHLASGLNEFETQHLVLPPGQRTWWPRAADPREAMIFVLEGRPDLWLDGTLHPLVIGDVVTLHAGDERAHTIVNHGSADARVLVVRSRAGVRDAAHFGDRVESTVANSPAILA